MPRKTTPKDPNAPKPEGFISKLQRENAELKAEIAVLKTSGAATSGELEAQAATVYSGAMTPPLVEVQSDRRWVAEGPCYYREEISFAEDTGYDANFYSRLKAALDRAVGLRDNVMHKCGDYVPIVVRGQNLNAWEWTKLPPFSPKNRVCVTIEFKSAPAE